ncbi:PACE efflux transporter [Kaistia terrae]|uniref:PACE efflux transporter n=1 Tax=Kaistia terrae TaxID=537017 RepID=A0ABW0PUJ8_9HYPH|nr:PACE efflux transporter [Kaistia terrae]MCX5576838.1 PACE efflux transporter [Kaistia terrae]
MQGVLRRVVYISTFEVTGIIISALILAYLSGTAPSHTGPLAVMTSALAVTVNLAYTSLFERWEASRPVRSRSLGRRVLHALGFQITLLVFLIPLMAWWMDMSLVEALILDTALIVFFPVYMFVFNWVFDTIFGLPDAVTKGFDQEAGEAA